MRENIKMRLYGLAFLGMMGLFLCVHLGATNSTTKLLALSTSGIWLIAFLIVQYYVYKLETKVNEKWEK